MEKCCCANAYAMAKRTWRYRHSSKCATDIMPLSGNDTIMRSWAFFVFDAISSVMHETGNVDLLSSITLDDMLCMPQSQHFALMENLITNVCEHVAKATRTGIISWRELTN